jgi:hypothetical protein
MSFPSIEFAVHAGHDKSRCWRCWLKAQRPDDDRHMGYRVTEVALIDRGWEPGQRSKQCASFHILLQYDTVACSECHALTNLKNVKVRIAARKAMRSAR